MEILAHRGMWMIEEEKNSYKAIKRAFENGFGIETDIRDYCGRLVISHNIADESCIEVEDVFRTYKELGCGASLALNVKADGIQNLLIELLEKYSIDNYFLFDMSVPEMVVNRHLNLNYYTRQSDIEKECILYDDAKGIWLDSFYDSCILDVKKIMRHIDSGKVVTIVSEELHGRNQAEMWKNLKRTGLHESKKIKLCTDKSTEARRFFYGE